MPDDGGSTEPEAAASGRADAKPGGSRSSTATPDVEALRATREEARQVVDHQIAYLNDIDDRAMRTVRIGVVVLAAFASAVKLGDDAVVSDPASVAGVVTAVGAVLLTGAIVSGVLTYSVSDPDFGIGAADVREARRVDGAEAAWLRVLLRGYEEWIAENNRVNRRDATYLWWSQFLLAGGVALLSTGVGLSVWIY